MIRVKLLGSLGVLPDWPIEEVYMPEDPEIIASDERHVAWGGLSPDVGFDGNRQILELRGTFHYADGPEEDTTPYRGSVDRMSVYISNVREIDISFTDL